MSYTEFYCQTTGSNLNAGSTTADSASLTYASGNWVQSTGVFTVASGNPSSDGVVVGDFVSVYADGASVTGFVGRVTARDATTITVSLTAKSGTAPSDGTGNRTLKVGGAWAGPNGTSGFPFNVAQKTMTNSSNHRLRVNFKSGTNYDITAAMTHGNIGPITFEGYTSSPGDGGLFTVDGGTSGASYALLTISVTACLLKNAIFQNNGASGSASGIVLSGASSLHGVCVNNVRGIGVNCSSRHYIKKCEAYACNQSNTSNLAGFVSSANAMFVRCVSHDHTAGTNCHGFVFGGFAVNSANFRRCIADTCSGAGFLGASETSGVISQCDAYNNGSHGLSIITTAAGSGFVSSLSVENSNFVKNGGYGINCDANDAIVEVHNCGFGAGTMANTSGQTNGLSALGVVEGSVTYPNDVTPWTDQGDGDFRISLSQAKNAGIGAFLHTQSGYGSPNATVGYPDIGAAPHLDAGGGGGGGAIMRPVSMNGGFV